MQESALLLEETSQRFVAERDALLEHLTQSRRQTVADMEAYVAAVDEVSRRWVVRVKMPSRKRSRAVQRHEELSGTLKTGSMDINGALYSRVQSCRRRKRSATGLAGSTTQEFSVRRRKMLEGTPGTTRWPCSLP